MAETETTFRAADVQVGDVIGSLEMLSRSRDGKRYNWHCRCIDCKRERSIRSDHLRRYVGTTCHCTPHQKHGLSRVREYLIWTKMVSRCHDPNSNNYRWYGAIGRYVCDGWRNSYQSFIADVGFAPSRKHTIDRIETTGSYTCGHCEQCADRKQTMNCRWATKDVQVRNAKNNLHFTHDGKTMILKDWARESGVEYHTVYARILRGWNTLDAIFTPPLKTWSNRLGDSNAPNRKGPTG